MSLEKDFLVYIKNLKAHLQLTDDPIKACLAEEWVYKLMLQDGDPNIRNYVTYYLVKQFGDQNFRPWFTKENLLKSLNYIAIQIDQDLMTSGSSTASVTPTAINTGNSGQGDMSWGQMKYDTIKSWIEGVECGSNTDISSSNNAISHANVTNLCQNLEQNLKLTHESMTTLLTSIQEENDNGHDDDSNKKSIMYQNFIKQHIPLIISCLLNGQSKAMPVFSSNEIDQNEFKSYENVIIDILQPKITSFETKIDEQTQIIKELEEKIKILSCCDKVDVGTETAWNAEFDERYVRKLKEKYEEIKQNYHEYKKNVGKCMETVYKDSEAINMVLEKSKSRMTMFAQTQLMENEEKVGDCGDGNKTD